jgi:hypothetical protein
MVNTCIGLDGILQIYPTIQGGTEVYMKDDLDKEKINVSYGKGSYIKYTTKKRVS